ncbi:guanylate-binding protein 1-like [Ascaphus truei]|uniref:guanylate-binding protein 1-like n=1 Tax=Ascaphus truei TaxID=8439 RepID=UPI003F5A058C
MAPEIAMPLPVCLIENRDRQELVINQEAAQILSDITQPVVVVAIVGKYRTGKSYLMNKLAGRSDGFALGSTVQLKTKGIWMWCVPHPSKPGHTLVLLDTEGLGDVEKRDSKNDAWIFSLAVLLSSNLVFNSMGTIDQQAMEQLHYVTELTKRIRLKSSPAEAEDESAEFKRIFPSFTWCVRDFTLILEQDGKEVTEDEYLMNALKLKPGSTKVIKDYNLPRECIISFFHSHKCFVFHRPASKIKLQHLEEVPESELEEEFVEQTQRFCTYMFKNGRVKTLAGGHLISGKLLGHLAVTYVEAIRSGSVPCMENAVLALAEIENTGAVEDALSKYEAEMGQRVAKFPTETQEEFLYLHREGEEAALKVFLGRSFKDENQKYQHQLKKLLDQKMKDFSQRNEEVSVDLCRALIQKLSVTLETGLSQGEYSRPGGHKHFLEEKLKLLEAYNKKPKKGIKALEVLHGFLLDKKPIEDATMQADNTLTQKEKEIAEQRAQAEAAERDKQILQNNRRLQQLMEDQKRSYELNEKMMSEKNEEERLRMIRENEWLIEQKEQEATLCAGFTQRTDALEREIQGLRNQKGRDDQRQASKLPAGPVQNRTPGNSNGKVQLCMSSGSALPHVRE